MNHYETVFILTPVLSDVQMKEAVEKFKTILTEQGAVIVNEKTGDCANSPILSKKRPPGSTPCWNSTPNLLSSLNWKSNSVVTNV